jgi:hypothetical protein
MGATVMKAIPGNQGESTDKPMQGMNMASNLVKSNMPETTQPGDEMKMSKKKKKKKKDKQTILTSTAGVTDEAEISNRSLMGGGSY